MKSPAILVIILISVLSAVADYPTVQEATSHLFTNAVIIWKAPTDTLPQSFWIYQRTLPRIFSETVISNAFVLGSLQQKDFPKSSTKDFYIQEDFPPNWPGAVPDIFGIRPNDALLFYQMPGYAADSKRAGVGIPNDKMILAQAWKYARQLGLDTNKMALKSFYTHFCNADDNRSTETNAVCSRGVFLSRQLDGVSFFADDEEGDGGEGFFVEFGGNGKIRSYSLRWSDVHRGRVIPMATPQEIIHHIQIHKILVLPDVNEKDYFTRLQKLASTRRVIVTRITPYYFEGVFGESPTVDALSKLITPVAELDAIADLGNSRAVVHMLTPIFHQRSFK